MIDDKILPSEEEVMVALATYRFLTPQQMLRIGVCSDKSHLYGVLRAMKPPKKSKNPDAEKRARRKQPIVNEIEFGFGNVDGKWAKRSSMYYLTPYGAEVMHDHERVDHFEPSRGVTVFDNDYNHRLHVIDFHIALRQWAAKNDADVDFFHTDFDPKTRGSGELTKRTTVRLKQGSIVPDAVFQFTTPGRHEPTLRV